MYHTVIIGGGCRRVNRSFFAEKINKIGKGEKACLIEKAVLCAAESDILV